MSADKDNFRLVDFDDTFSVATLPVSSNRVVRLLVAVAIAGVAVTNVAAESRVGRTDSLTSSSAGEPFSVKPWREKINF